MIVFYHDNHTVVEIASTEAEVLANKSKASIAAILLDTADQFRDEILVWCHHSERENLNLTVMERLFHHKKLLYSYNPSGNYFNRFLGYIEDSPFIKINKEVRYATWQMTSRVGAVHASVLNACRASLRSENNFDYFLNSFSRRAMPLGLLCYSEPQLLLNRSTMPSPNANLFELFKFTKQHYRLRWIFVLFFNLMVYEKKFAVLPFLFSFFCFKRQVNPELLNRLGLSSDKKIVESGTIDVLIPTIGRREYLQNVLNNLATQTHLPKIVILIEQNPLENSRSELDFIHSQAWPFTIKHHFTHQAGACNARNIGLDMIESEFTFLADDDIVFDNDLLQKALETFASTGNEVFLVACHLKSQNIPTESPKQFAVFGAGHAFVKSSSIKDLKFNMGYEFGFGEDNDFGMQLRNRGFDILYISTSRILHLKAPIGGFRTKPVLKWQHEEIQPKPSPTVMLFRLLYDTPEQLSNYKTTLFFKNLNKSFIFDPLGYIKSFMQKWDKSIFWANELKKQQS